MENDAAESLDKSIFWFTPRIIAKSVDRVLGDTLQQGFATKRSRDLDRPWILVIGAV